MFRVSEPRLAAPPDAALLWLAPPTTATQMPPRKPVRPHNMRTCVHTLSKKQLRVKKLVRQNFDGGSTYVEQTGRKLASRNELGPRPAAQLHAAGFAFRD